MDRGVINAHCYDINGEAGREIPQGRDLYMQSAVANFQLAAIEKHARMGYIFVERQKIGSLN